MNVLGQTGNIIRGRNNQIITSKKRSVPNKSSPNSPKKNKFSKIQKNRQDKLWEKDHRFLVPSKEGKSFLGAIWSSVIFSNRSDEDSAAFTLFVGGSRDPGFVDDNEEAVVKRVRDEYAVNEMV